MSKLTKKNKMELVQEEKHNTENKVETNGETDLKNNLTYNSYLELQNELSAIQERLSILKINLKKHYKLTNKQIQKMNKSKRQNTNLREPTGFGKPCFVPPTLRTLLKIGENECVTRPAVTQKLYSYIKDNSLFDANDKRLLRVNDSLSKALQLSPQEVKYINSSSSPYLPNDDKEKKKRQIDKNAFSFFNIQKYVAKLYPKDEKNIEILTEKSTNSSVTKKSK
jgi:chromatin remodeling complex protein RSC6